MAQATKIKEGIYWVGGIDWTLRNFHGYLTQRGSTYNAYLIIDEKITLIDTVKHYLADELLERIASIVDPAQIDYVVSNHVEMDHSGALPQIMARATKAQLITSAPNGEKGLRLHYKQDWPFKAVKSGDSLSLGKRTLQFVGTPMVHWPDNMVTYLPEEQLLFSNDAFGQHIASEERFDDELPLATLLEEAQKYYANIVLPYGKQVQGVFAALASLDIKMIAPSHGLIWRSQIPAILSAYQNWAANQTEERALIIFDSMWDSTTKIAGAIQSAFHQKGLKAEPLDLKTTHISDVMAKLQTARYICVGSPTLNNQMLPTVAAFLVYMQGLAPKNRCGLAFGSYGWGGQSIGQIETVLQNCGFTLLPQIKVNYVPDQAQLEGITGSLFAAL